MGTKPRRPPKGVFKGLQTSKVNQKKRVKKEKKKEIKTLNQMNKFKVDDIVREIGQSRKMKVLGYRDETTVLCLYKGEDGHTNITCDRDESVLLEWNPKDTRLTENKRDKGEDEEPFFDPFKAKRREPSKEKKEPMCSEKERPSGQPNKFNKGDVVNHKSGGDKMVVMGYTNNKVNCSWMDGYRYVIKDFFEFELKLNTIPDLGFFSPDNPIELSPWSKK